MKRLEDLINNYVYGANYEHSDDEAQRRLDILQPLSLVAYMIASAAFGVAVVELLEFMIF